MFLVTFSFSLIFLIDPVSNSYAQNPTNSQSPAIPISTPESLGVKITAPTNEQQISFQNNNNDDNIQIKGTSTDNIEKDCQVSVIANDIKPYQNAIATGQGGKNDYSTWTYSLDPTLIKQGSNKVTARISCVDPVITGGNMEKHFSVFFTIQSTSIATAPVKSGPSSNQTEASTTTTTGIKNNAVPYFASRPNCQVQSLSYDLVCTIKITGIENVAKIRPFLHADLTTSCINPGGHTPLGKVKTTSVIGDGKIIRAAVDPNCPPSMTPRFTYENVELQVGDVLLSIPGTFNSK